MAATRDYRAVVSQVFEDLAEIVRKQTVPQPDGAETVCVRDDAGGHYLVLRYGWRNGRRVRAVSLYMRLCDGKVRIEEDMTDWDLVNRLTEKGVPPEQIVLAWQSASATLAEPVPA